MKYVYLCLILGCLGALVDGSRILLLFHMPSPSHQILGGALGKALAAKGHAVTMATPFKNKETIPNYRHVYLDGLVDIMQELANRLSSVHNTSMIEQIFNIGNMTDRLTEASIISTGIQELLNNPNEKFDLIIFEAIMNEAQFGLAHHFNAPFIVLSTSGSQLVNHLVGNSAPYSFVTNMMSAAVGKMTFTERLRNTATGIFLGLAWNYKFLPSQEILYQKYFKDGPEFMDIVKNVSLVFVNSHVCLETPRPYMPSMIAIGGFHVAEPKKLPKDLQTFLDEADKGAILFSLGSNLKSSELPVEKLKILMDTFRKIPQKILWKFEVEDLPGKPDNVKISKWLPQNDILAHPNVKAFVSHGGLLSTTEAMYRGVPIIGIPFFGDQNANTANMVAAGYGIKLDFGDITEESFTEAITSILTDPKYKENIKKRSEIIRDQPLKPIDSAIFWIEHIIRHKGGKHLRSSALDVTLFEYLLLDIAMFVAVILGTFLVGTILLCKILCCSKKKDKSGTITKKLKAKRE